LTFSSFSHDPELKRRLNVKIFDGLGARGRFVVRRRDDAKRASWGLAKDTDTPTKHGSCRGLEVSTKLSSIRTIF
jgi:hypothetical protein